MATALRQVRQKYFQLLINAEGLFWSVSADAMTTERTTPDDKCRDADRSVSISGTCLPAGRQQAMLRNTEACYQKNTLEHCALSIECFCHLRYNIQHST